jgi:diaminopimelate epimerase
VTFWKLQSIGNDFPLVHIEDRVFDFGPLAISMCDRRFGVGGDGLLAACKVGEERVLLRMFNPDGTEDFCGNGLRCAAVHARTQGWVGDTFTIEHLGREVPVRIQNGQVTTRLGGAFYEPEAVPLRGAEQFRAPLPGGRIGSSLSTGTTHTIVWVDELPGDQVFFAESPVLEVHEMFPERTSVIWTQEITTDHLKLRIWERGVGETQGCGTGSTAAAVDYLRGAGRAGRVRVDNPGGTVFVTWDPITNQTEIEGTAEQVFAGVYRL